MPSLFPTLLRHGIAKIKFNVGPRSHPGRRPEMSLVGVGESLRGALGASLRAPLIEFYLGDAMSELTLARTLVSDCTPVSKTWDNPSCTRKYIQITHPLFRPKILRPRSQRLTRSIANFMQSGGRPFPLAR